MISLPPAAAFAYSLVDGATVVIQVTGLEPVEYAAVSTHGEFGEPLGTIGPGESLELVAPGQLRAQQGSSTVELTYIEPAATSAEVGEPP